MFRNVRGTYDCFSHELECKLNNLSDFLG
jgi:hypothetical protein